MRLDDSPLASARDDCEVAESRRSLRERIAITADQASTLCRLLLLLIAVCLAGCHSSESPQTVTVPNPNSPLNAVPASEIRIVVSGDTRGWIMPCGCTANQSGGLLRRATYVQQLKNQSDVVVADCGGAAEGTAPYQQSRFRAILLGEKQMGLQAHNVGASEAALGAETLKRLATETGVAFISANITTNDGQPIVQTHRLLEQSGQRLLITGVCSPSLLGDSGLYASAPGDAILAVLKQRAAQFDRVIVLAWLPVDELRQLAETLPEADVIVGGPTGQSLPPETIGRVLLTSATNKGKFIACLKFPASVQDDVSAEIVELSPTYADDETQKSNLDAFREMLGQRDFTAAESGFAPSDSVGSPSSAQVAGTESCRECHTEACTGWDSTPHAHAWERLVTQKSAVDPYCQQCHTTGYGLAGGFVSMKESIARTNVGCESCHGPSADHVKDNKHRTPVDAIGACLRCHDHENSPHFEFAGYWEKIRHE